MATNTGKAVTIDSKPSYCDVASNRRRNVEKPATLSTQSQPRQSSGANTSNTRTWQQAHAENQRTINELRNQLEQQKRLWEMQRQEIRDQFAKLDDKLDFFLHQQKFYSPTVRDDDDSMDEEEEDDVMEDAPTRTPSLNSIPPGSLATPSDHITPQDLSNTISQSNATLEFNTTATIIKRPHYSSDAPSEDATASSAKSKIDPEQATSHLQHQLDESRKQIAE
ncbi:hypothetical protein BGZ80_009492, partial [Entomortierella chlamydospora]